MSKSTAEDLVRALGAYNRWEGIGGSKTQATGEVLENFVGEKIKGFFSKEIYFDRKLGSQQHPDFAFVSNLFKRQFNKFLADEELETDEVTLKTLHKWEGMGNNTLWVEVKKTTANSYTLNDTFPPSPDVRQELYVFFDVSNRGVHTVTSDSIHQIISNQRGIDLTEMYRHSAEIINRFQNELDNCWAGSDVGTAARPTYSLPLEVAHVDELDKKLVLTSISNLLKRTGFID